MVHTRRSTPAALLGLAAASLIPATAHPVHRDPGGLGQALIFPYYTTRSVDGNAFNTYVSIVNHTSDTKALRVRFREGQNGREVAGFNLYLAPNDTWTGAVVPPPAPNLPARLVTADRSCVTGFTANPSASVPFLDFRNALYAGASSDGLGDGLDRTREGYIEALEMATIPPGAVADALRPGSDGTSLPPDCGVANVPSIVVAAPTGGVSGTLTLINVMSGLDFTSNAEALAELATQPYYRVASDPYPDFNVGEVSPVTQHSANGKVYRIDWGNRAFAVSAALTTPRAENEIILDTLTQSATDWVVTFPTKRLHGTAVADGGPFAASLDPDRRSIPFELAFFPRDGAGVSLVNACVGLCPPGTVTTTLRLPFASTVVGFRRGATAAGAVGISGVLGSVNAWLVTIPSAAQNGAAALRFDGFYTTPRTSAVNALSLRLSDGVLAPETIRIEGMPALGFALRTFRNGSLACGAGTCQGNYGGSFPHKWRTAIGP